MNVIIFFLQCPKYVMQKKRLNTDVLLIAYKELLTMVWNFLNIIKTVHFLSIQILHWHWVVRPPSGNHLWPSVNCHKKLDSLWSLRCDDNCVFARPRILIVVVVVGDDGGGIMCKIAWSCYKTHSNFNWNGEKNKNRNASNFQLFSLLIQYKQMEDSKLQEL